MDLLFAAIAAVKNKEEDGESKQRKVRLYDPKTTHAVYQRVKARRVASLREQVKRIWELFPADGIKRLCSSSMEDSNHNYGLHQSNLGFDTVPKSNSEGRINGTRTMGLRYENEHTVHLHKRDMCPYSEKHLLTPAVAAGMGCGRWNAFLIDRSASQTLQLTMISTSAAHLR